MNIRFLMTVVVMSALVGVSACSSLKSAGHEYLMRGQVVEVAGSEAVVCIGSADGARVSQELTAYKLVNKNPPGGPGKNPPRWERVQVGTVRIVQVVDEHFAKAQVTSGDVKVNDIVEMKP
ncbi:MAG: hypothetical protein ABL989_08165 [Gammaproteobacteria bacterium]